MPDNTADYEDDADRLDLDEADTPEALAWNLLVLINPGDEDTALRQFDLLRERLAAGDDQPLPWLLRDIVDWTSGFFVGPDEIDATMEALDELAARYGLQIEWGGDRDDEDFMEGLDVPQLLSIAYDSLRPHGYTLWCWNADADGYGGWMALRRDDEAMRALSQLLGFDLRLASEAG
ncbi:DUF6630 family protein [Pseudoxanthomonas winnipegensis]|uniref:DUF6630 domain-containing protein n=1 Tax=Pseudoxanthomonas winnipegensis TaxID=2480810 RepID=A0A4Q8LRP6_9GAMM|nr:hypothetical protein [Pseudoxanthomonas winnipegensis]RZZ88094.1 hypothetical protein EA663_04325 [Pseudoxanthomonas winnipegensis]TAA34377.1 hypothetical protein EA656_11565 [Pseudoxanthomonas winnipegensis]